MKMVLFLEACQPNGTCFRMAVGISVPFVLISTVAALTRLF